MGKREPIKPNLENKGQKEEERERFKANTEGLSYPTAVSRRPCIKVRLRSGMRDHLRAASEVTAAWVVSGLACFFLGALGFFDCQQRSNGDQKRRAA